MPSVSLLMRHLVRLKCKGKLSNFNIALIIIDKLGKKSVIVIVIEGANNPPFQDGRPVTPLVDFPDDHPPLVLTNLKMSAVCPAEIYA